MLSSFNSISKEDFKNKNPKMQKISDASLLSLQQQYGLKIENYVLPPPPASEEHLPCNVVAECGKHFSRDKAIEANPLCEKINADVDFRRCKSMKHVEPVVDYIPKEIKSSSQMIMGRM